MARIVVENHYATLGVSRGISADELRRVYHQLALEHHPDRAGDAATETFQKITAAYSILGDPEKRAVYDRRLRETEESAQRPQAGTYDDAGATWRARREPVDRAEYRDLIARLSGSIDELIARGVARQQQDGIIELSLNAGEARTGGTAAIDAKLRVACANCAGMAARRRLWCKHCEYEGTILDDVTVCVPIPAMVADRTLFTFPVDPTGSTPPLRVRVRV